MDDYIKKSDVLNASKIVYIECLETDDDGYLEADADDIPVILKRDVEKLPAADVAPVVHGEWINRGGILECSNCGHVAPYDVEGDVIMYWPEQNYCYCCGAKMDKT